MRQIVLAGGDMILASYGREDAIGGHTRLVAGKYGTCIAHILFRGLLLI